VAAEAQPEGSPRSVLVVTDDERVRTEARFGAPAGVEVVTAEDAREATRVLESLHPAAVVVDMQTGNAGGFSLARTLSESPRLSNIPVLILLERAQDAWLARTAGARAIATKPLPPGELARRITELLPGSS
jgi:DNA-binding response OmpR family regulator